MAAPTTGLTVIKRFPYRGDSNEEFSNHYWFTGTTPADSTAWRTLFDALVTQEKTVYPSSVSVVAGYGYDSVAASAHAVWSVDLTVTPNTPVAGTLSMSGLAALPGDTAWWIRWGLDRFNSKGKRIYLRKYFHPGIANPAAYDYVPSGLSTAAAAFGAKMDDGSFASGRKITDTLGTNTVGHAVGQFVTTRTLKRRGKRPS